ncbi:constitutive coactivator of peroxisome proliferator-activated receptor gamma isoform X2 [Scophthalmus maximus]|uniref:constitutive coactivator of peroxisome proliferator-activated receptor gamma isoform X2 n=1 Tax=Scophthalmus maximus TaxID=52904 RepID=UPI001FA93DCB|nr:constitutive coactivator of peroxisome proliferator-activated receptor gamma isoform X2 [Scophthalmus maximus]
MGVKGLQYFMDCCCPEVCVTVNLRDMAEQHVARSPDTAPCSDSTDPTLVVDGMACLRHWYSCKNWVCGGQWREYMDVLQSWVEAFNSAGIRLVFFFDGVVEEQKRKEWVKRRRRVNGEISKIFRYIKAHEEQPGRELFCLPSGLATFTCFALRSFGQEVFCSVQEADYEVASYARQHGSMGILGQDSDFIIYDRKKSPVPHHGAPQGQMVLAVSQFVSSLWGREEEEPGHILQSMTLSAFHQELLERGICAYLLPGQEGLHRNEVSARPPASAFEKYVSPEILKACREKHVAAEGFMVYGVVCEGVIECSNTLEDEEDTELLPQALVYKPCRQHIYGLLLGHDGSAVDPPAIREWFVYPGNPLKEPDVVHPVSLPCGRPSLDSLWFGTGSNVSALRLTSFLTIFDCQEFSELYGTVDASLLAALCLVTYIVLQVQTVSQEDVDAYLSQVVCLSVKSPQDIRQIKLPFLSSRAVQLGSLYVRGLSHLLGANCASGCPLPNAALMPWHSFDGVLFHSKYLLAHSGTDKTVLLDSDSSCLSLFLHLREKLLETCRKRGRVLQSRPRHSATGQSHKTTTGPRGRERPTGWPSGGGERWKSRGEMTGAPRHGGGWRERAEESREQSDHDNRERLWERGGHRGGEMRGSQHFHHFYPECHGEGPQSTSHRPKQSRGRSYRSRGRYRLAPRWSEPPAPGT